MTVKEKLVPELRFPEFTDEWEEKELGEEFNFSKGKGIPKKELSYKGNKCILYGQLYTIYEEIIEDVRNFIEIDIEKLVLSEYGDILLPSSGETALEMSSASALLLDGIALGGDINILRAKSSNIDSKFISYQINAARQIDIARISEGSSVVHLYNSNLKKIKIVYPSYQEQQKIGNFFYTIDKKLELQRKKIEELKNYKKGMMQRIFDQEIRFKDEDGNEYPEWEEKRLEEIGEFLTSSVNKKIKKNEEIVKLYNYMDVYNKISVNNKNLDKLSITSATKTQIKNNNLLKGDILITPSSETPEDIGHSVVIKENLQNTLYSYHLVRFRPNITMDILFSNYWFNNENVRKEFIIRSQGATRFTLSINNIKKVKVKYPCNSEQEKIGLFLSAVDKKIELEENKLSEYEEYKKGLMQRMFV